MMTMLKNNGYVIWSDILESNVRIIYSSLCIPDDRDRFAEEVAAFELKSGNCIDVEWKFGEYKITVFKDFENPLYVATCENPNQVIELVKNFCLEF